MKRLKLIVAAASLLAPLNFANAADIDVAPYDWSGIYLGAHVGASFADISFSDPTAPNHFFIAGQNYDFDWNALSGGARIGAQYQADSFVFGLEGTWSELGDEKHDADPGVFSNISTAVDVDNLITVAGRMGYAHDRWLGFIKGGLANAEIGTSASESPFFDHSGSSSKNTWGYVLGAGVEYAVTDAVVVGLEYNYIDLNSKTHSGTDSINFAPYTLNVDPEGISTVWATMSYKFNL